MKTKYLNEPEHYRTEKEADKRARKLAPRMFPAPACIIDRKDKDGRWHICTRGQASGLYPDAVTVHIISTDGNVDMVNYSASDADEPRSRKRGQRRGRCAGCGRKVEKDALYAVPGRSGKLCMTCATEETK